MGIVYSENNVVITISLKHTAQVY